MFTESFKSKIPVVFLFLVSAWWAFYYQHTSSLNDFGRANYEWLYLIDGFLLAPFLCFLFIKDKSKAAKQCVLIALTSILIGSLIIPDEHKQIWSILEYGRYPVIVLFLLFEIIVIVTTLWAIHKALTIQGDPDIAISKAINNLGISGPMVSLISVEIRMWMFTFTAKRIHPRQFKGDHHFSYHQKDGAQSNALGFIFIILFELPMMHVFLHFVWSPLAANVVTFLSILSLIWFYAEYKAMSRRPVSLTHDDLMLRYGLFPEHVVRLDSINDICINKTAIRRKKSLKRFNYAGIPNVKITLKSAKDHVDEIYLGLDQPENFIKLIKERKC